MDCVRIVNNLWTAEEVMDQPKLCVLKELMGRVIETRCVEVMRKMRGVLTKLGGGYSRTADGDEEREKME